MAQAIRTQNDFRQDVRPVDQFGRKWFGSIERATGDFCGSVVPARWTDPLKTPMVSGREQVLRIPRDQEGYPMLGKVVVNFDAWIAVVEQDESEWYQNLLNIAAQKYNKMDPNDIPHLENDPFIRGLAGRKPFPSSKVLKMARDGDKQFLGLEPLDNAHKELLGIATYDAVKMASEARQSVAIPKADDATIPPPPLVYQDFVSWLFKYQGCKDLGEAGRKWKEFAANFGAKVEAAA